jgi:alpha-L-fucosidase
MKVNGDAIYGTSASPFKKLDWGRCTAKISDQQTTLYFHVFNWPTDGKLVVPGLKNKVISAHLLKSNWIGTHKKLTVINTNSGVTLSVPKTAPDKISSTIVLLINGKPDVTQ